MEYYVLPNKPEADAFLDAYINGSGLFPVKDGQYVAVCWAEESRELADGRAAIPCIPAKLLDHHGIPKDTQDGFLAALEAFKGTIEELERDAFPVAEPNF